MTFMHKIAQKDLKSGKRQILFHSTVLKKQLF